jgi:chromosome segregation ATPase
MSRKSNLNEREITELKRQFEAERRKSMSIEESIIRIQRDNKAKAGEVEELQAQLAENKEDIDDLSDKLKKAQEIIDALEEDNEHLRAEIDHIHNATININNFGEQIEALRRRVADTDRSLSAIDAQIRNAKNDLEGQKRAIDEKQRRVGQLAGEGKRLSRKESGSVNSESTEEEKNHVIKVLEHESKLYNLERNMLKLMGSPQQPQHHQLPQTVPFAQQQYNIQPYSKPSVQRVSSPIYQLNDANRPF